MPVVYVSKWGTTTAPIKTPSGTVPYRTWCENEAERINRNGGRVRVMDRFKSKGQFEVCIVQKGRRNRNG